LKPQTVLNIHRVLSNALSDAVRVGLVSRNVAQFVETPKVFRKEVYTLDWKQVHRLLGQIRNPLYRDLVLLAVQTGLRRSELLGLYWRDVDLAGAALSVQRARVRRDSGLADIMPTKSGKARVLVLPGESVDMLRARWEFRPVGSEFIFCHSDGRPCRPDQVSRQFKEMAGKAGLEGLRFHDLRHTHASLLLSAGVHLKVASERLGHSTIGITADLYSHVQPAVQREAVEVFGAAWRLIRDE
jgi:integrase